MAIQDIKKIVQKDGIVFMTYVGFMSQTILSGMIEAVEHDQKLSGIPNKLTHNILSVLIEMAQNIMKYSSEKIEDELKFNSNGLVLVGKNTDDDFYVHSQNIVKNKEKERIEKRLTHIKELDEDKLKEEFRKLRRSALHSHEKGAGIGFYDIARRSKDIKFEFEKIDENNYEFYFTVNIK